MNEEHGRALAKEFVDTCQAVGLVDVPDPIKQHVFERLMHFDLKPTDEVLLSALQAVAEVIAACRVFSESDLCKEMSGPKAMDICRQTFLVHGLVLAQQLIARPVGDPRQDRAYL